MIYIIQSLSSNNSFKPIFESYENDLKPIDESNKDNLKLNLLQQNKLPTDKLTEIVSEPNDNNHEKQYTAHTIYEISMEEPSELDMAILETTERWNHNILLSKETREYRRKFDLIQANQRKQIQEQKAREFIKSSIPDEINQKLDDMWSKIDKQ